MSKVWEFAVSPKQAAIIGACLTFAGVLLSGAGVVAGLLLAPRFPSLEARLATNPKTLAVKVPRIAAPTVPAPAPPKSGDAAKAPPSEGPAVQPAGTAQPDIAGASQTASPTRTGLESAVLGSPTPPVAAPVTLANGVQMPAIPGAPTGAAALPSALTGVVPSPGAGIALKPAALPIQMTVRVGSFGIAENARNFVERLNRFGYHALDIPGTDALGRHWNVVQVGPYAGYDDASKAVMELSAKYRLEPVIVPVTTY